MDLVRKREAEQGEERITSLTAPLFPGTIDIEIAIGIENLLRADAGDGTLAALLPSASSLRKAMPGAEGIVIRGQPATEGDPDLDGDLDDAAR